MTVNMVHQLILYVCPTGPMARQIETYFEQSQQRYGPNAAHAYMPHCTLTGFFEDEEGAVTLENGLCKESLEVE
ncbi:MAG: hypothetical protein WA885_22160 [Phormidesmis sp.]